MPRWLLPLLVPLALLIVIVLVTLLFLPSHTGPTGTTTAVIDRVPAVYTAQRLANAAAYNGPQSIPPAEYVKSAPEPGPPFAPLPAYGALVHLKAGACSQVVSVSVKTIGAGGRGIVFYSDTGGPNGNDGFHWITQYPPTWAFGVGRVYAGFYEKLDIGAPGSYTLAFGSSDCSVPGSSPQTYAAAATVVKITAT